MYCWHTCLPTYIIAISYTYFRHTFLHTYIITIPYTYFRHTCLHTYSIVTPYMYCWHTCLHTLIISTPWIYCWHTSVHSNTISADTVCCWHIGVHADINTTHLVCCWHIYVHTDFISARPVKHLSVYTLTSLQNVSWVADTFLYLQTSVPFAPSKLDYCNSLLSGRRRCPLSRLQKVWNSAVELDFKARKRDHVTSPLQSLHWLPAQAKIEYKLSTICHNSHLPGSFVLLQDTQMLRIQHVETKTFGQRCYSYRAVWSYLPSDIHHIQSSHDFRTVLKSHLHKQYHDRWFQILSPLILPPPPNHPLKPR